MSYIIYHTYHICNTYIQVYTSRLIYLDIYISLSRSQGPRLRLTRPHYRPSQQPGRIVTPHPRVRAPPLHLKGPAENAKWSRQLRRTARDAPAGRAASQWVAGAPPPLTGGAQPRPGHATLSIQGA